MANSPTVWSGIDNMIVNWDNRNTIQESNGNTIDGLIPELVAGLNNGAVQYLEDEVWTELKDDGWRHAVNQMEVEWDDDGNPYIVVGLSGGAVEYYDSTKWFELHDNSWVHPVTQLAVNWNNGKVAEAVVGLGGSAVEYYNGKTGQWTELHNNSWAYPVNQMEVEWQNGNPRIVVGLGGPGAVEYYNGSSWTELQGNGWENSVNQMEVDWNEDGNPYIVVGLGGGAVEYYDSSQWFELKDNGWDHPVTEMEVNFNAQGKVTGGVVVGLGNGSVQYYQSNGTWQELHDPSWSSAVNQMEVNWKSGTPQIVVGLEDGAVEYYNGSSWTELHNTSWKSAVNQMAVNWNGNNTPEVLVGLADGVTFYYNPDTEDWWEIAPNYLQIQATNNNQPLGPSTNDQNDIYSYSNSFIGSDRNDTIDAGLGNDYVVGGSGTDSLYGNDGSDLLATGAINGNNNILTGGEGHDIFINNLPAEPQSMSFTQILGIEKNLFDWAGKLSEVTGQEELVPVFTGISKALGVLIRIVNFFDPPPRPPTVGQNVTVITDFDEYDTLILPDGDYRASGYGAFAYGGYSNSGVSIMDDNNSTEIPIIEIVNPGLNELASKYYTFTPYTANQIAGGVTNQNNWMQFYVNQTILPSGNTGSSQNSYIKEATVFLDENDNGKLDENELSTTTNEDGYHDPSLVETDTKEGKLVSVGGTKVLDNQTNELVFTAPKEFSHVSPLSTLFTAISPEGITQEQLASSLGIIDIHSNILDMDHIQDFIESFKRDNDYAETAEQKVLLNQQIGSLMEIGAEYLVNEGIVETKAEGGAMMIASLADLIKEAVDEGATFDLENEAALTELFVKSGLDSSTATEAVEEYLAEDFDSRLLNLLATFDPENDEETEVIYGGKEGDEITIPSSANQHHIIHGNGGTDVIDATESQAEHNHTIKGDSGADHIMGGNADTIMGGTGDDTIDTSTGGGSNHVYGQEDADVLIGGEDDTLSGGPGEDELYAGSGNTLRGGAEKDAFWLASDELPEKTITVEDFTPGEDVIGLQGIVINGRSLEFGDLVFTDVEGNTELGINDGEKVQPLATFLYISAEELNNPDNFVIPTPSMERIFGTTETDVIQVKNSVAPQLVFAGDGDDFVDATSANVAVQNVIYGGLGNDIITAGSKDILIGNEGDDAFYITSGGDNILTGGSGADQFWLATAEYPAAMNQITDFEVGIDVLGIGGLGLEFADLSLIQADNNTIVAIASNGLELATLLEVAPDQLSADNFAFV